jgi:hypothetical protein
MTVDFFKERFGYEIEGVWFPRVTSVTSFGTRSLAFKAIDPFGRKFGFQQAAEWGTLVHETIEKLLKGEKEIMDGRIKVSIETFQEWQKEYPLFIAKPQEDVECRVVNIEHGYAGTVDIIAKVDGVLSIIDLKTSTRINKEYGLQTAAYMNAYNSQQKEQKTCEGRWILRIDQYQECKGCLARVREKYGRAKVAGGNESCNHQWTEVKGEIEFKELKNYEKDLDAFLNLKERWEWTNKEWLQKIPNYEKNIRQYTLI